MRRWLGVALLSTFVGCYPEFGFVSDDAATATDSATPKDSSAADADNDAIFPADDTDVPVTDSALVDSAKPDTFVPTADTGPIVGCAGSTAVFCRDFEGVTSAESGWDGSYLRSGGVLNLDSTHVRSPTKAMYTFVPVATVEVSSNVHKASPLRARHARWRSTSGCTSTSCRPAAARCSSRSPARARTAASRSTSGAGDSRST